MLKSKLLNFVFLFLCSLSIWRVGFAPSLISLFPFSISWELETTVRLSTQTHTGAQCLQKVRSRVAMHGIHTPPDPPRKSKKRNPLRPCFVILRSEGRQSLGHGAEFSAVQFRPHCLKFLRPKMGNVFGILVSLCEQPLLPPPSLPQRPTPLPLVSVFVVVVRLSVCYDLYWFY